MVLYGTFAAEKKGFKMDSAPKMILKAPPEPSESPDAAADLYLVIVSYDTQVIAQHNEHNFSLWNLATWHVPAKYCITLRDGYENNRSLAQALVHDVSRMKQGIWFLYLQDWEAALVELKKLYPLQFPDTVYFIDHPDNSTHIKPGSSIVKPHPPQMVKRGPRKS